MKLLFIWLLLISNSFSKDGYSDENIDFFSENIVVQSLLYLKSNNFLKDDNYKSLNIKEENIGGEFVKKKIVTIIKDGLFDDSVKAEKIVLTLKLNKDEHRFNFIKKEVFYKCVRGKNQDIFVKKL